MSSSPPPLCERNTGFEEEDLAPGGSGSKLASLNERFIASQNALRGFPHKEKGHGGAFALQALGLNVRSQTLA